MPRGILVLPAGHLLGHVKEQSPVAFLDAPEQAAKAAQIARFFPSGTPGDIIRALTAAQIGEFRRFFAVIEELVKRHFHGARQFFECLNGRHRVPVLHARNIAAQKPGALFDVALRKFLCFTKQTNAFSNYHKRTITCHVLPEQVLFMRYFVKSTQNRVAAGRTNFDLDVT